MRRTLSGCQDRSHINRVAIKRSGNQPDYPWHQAGLGAQTYWPFQYLNLCLNDGGAQ
jgi:hypothetical protein